jgi:tRNA nucleotidyltransferase (CCA-adding enzyme)
MVCDMAARLAPGNARVGFAALVHDLGKALTPEEVRPKHINHEHAGLKPVRELCSRLRVPVAHRELAVLACREHLNVHRLFELRPQTVFELLDRSGGFRQPERIGELATVCEADKRGRLGLQDVPYPQAAELLRLLDVARAVGTAQLDLSRLDGPQIGEALKRARIRAIRDARTQGEAADAGER